MHREHPVSFRALPAATMDVLYAIAFHHGCKELTVPQRYAGEPHQILGEYCISTKWLDVASERTALLSHGMREVPAYLIALYNGGLSENTWFLALVTDNRLESNLSQARTLRIQHSPLEMVLPGEFAVAKTMPLPKMMPPSVEAVIDRSVTPKQRISQF